MEFSRHSTGLSLGNQVDGSPGVRHLVLQTASFSGRMLFLVSGSWKWVASEVWLFRQGDEGDRVGQPSKQKVEASAVRFAFSVLGSFS